MQCSCGRDSYLWWPAVLSSTHNFPSSNSWRACRLTAPGMAEHSAAGMHRLQHLHSQAPKVPQKATLTHPKPSEAEGWPIPRALSELSWPWAGAGRHVAVLSNVPHKPSSACFYVICQSLLCIMNSFLKLLYSTNIKLCRRCWSASSTQHSDRLSLSLIISYRFPLSYRLEEHTLFRKT